MNLINFITTSHKYVLRSRINRENIESLLHNITVFIGYMSYACFVISAIVLVLGAIVYVSSKHNKEKVFRQASQLFLTFFIIGIGTVGIILIIAM